MKKQVVRTTKQAAMSVARYEYARQKRCWAVVVEALQEYIPKTEDIDWEKADRATLQKYFPLNDKAELEIPIPAKYVVSGKHSIKATLLKMKKVDIIDEVDENGALHTYPLFYDIITYPNGQYGVGIVPRSLCWLLNFTKKVGYVSFCVQSFLRLTRPQAMMTYLYISSNMKRETWTARIEDIRKWVGASDSLDSWAFVNKYLEMAAREFEEVGTRLQFTFEKIKSKAEWKGLDPITAIRFTVTDNGSVLNPEDGVASMEECESEPPVEEEEPSLDEIIERERAKYEKKA